MTRTTEAASSPPADIEAELRTLFLRGLDGEHAAHQAFLHGSPFRVSERVDLHRERPDDLGADLRGGVARAAPAGTHATGTGGSVRRRALRCSGGCHPCNSLPRDGMAVHGHWVCRRHRADGEQRGRAEPVASRMVTPQRQVDRTLTDKRAAWPANQDFARS
jgi:hypothetical protein